MDVQTLVTTAIAAACGIYAGWALLPAGWRRAVAATLAEGPWPRPVARWFARRAAPGGACGCSGCDGAGAKPVTLVRRAGRR